MSFGVIYQGSVKDILGPVRVKLDDPAPTDCVLFRYSDAYSVFDWGRMPDALTGKGSALAVFAAAFFERLQLATTWKDFSKDPAAQTLRKANRFGSDFNEIGEILQRDGLKTHYVGLVPDAVVNQISLAGSQGSIPVKPLTLSQWKNPAFEAGPSNPRLMLVREVEVNRPRWVKVMGREIPDYRAGVKSTGSGKPTLIPLEVVFRFSCPEGSSLIERVKQDPEYLSQRGFADWKIEAATGGGSWDFPLIELFTKLETSDRPVSLTEALAISGLSAQSLQEMMMRTAWVAGWMRSVFAKKGITLADGKLEWAIQVPKNGKPELILVDAIGPDELRLLSGPVQLSKEFLRAHYRKTPWYEQIGARKKQAAAAGEKDWKKGAPQPPALPPATREKVQNLYFALAKFVLDPLAADSWFTQAPGLDTVIESLKEPT
ncbi:MAG: hypothetical protein JNL01_04585 [Bdellovibrionales bacterium]|nr:hypothetical protein [Bdellovibrionales bacterium]